MFIENVQLILNLNSVSHVDWPIEIVDTNECAQLRKKLNYYNQSKLKVKKK